MSSNSNLTATGYGEFTQTILGADPYLLFVADVENTDEEGYPTTEIKIGGLPDIEEETVIDMLKFARDLISAYIRQTEEK